MTFNTRILGGKISVFQSVSILGYCIFPLFFAMVILKILSMVGYNHILIKIFAMLIGALWGVMGNSRNMQLLPFSSQATSKNRRKQWHFTPFCYSTCSSRFLHSTCETDHFVLGSDIHRIIINEVGLHIKAHRCSWGW